MIRRFIFSHCPWFLRETFVRWIRNDGLNQAAAMAYYGALSFLPILLLLIAGLGHALAWYSENPYAPQKIVDAVKMDDPEKPEDGESNARKETAAKKLSEESIVDFVRSHTSDAMAEQVRFIIDNVITQAPKQTAFGLATLLISAIGIFTQLSAAFDRIWHQNSPELHGVWGAVKNALGFRLKAFVTLVGFAFLVLLGFLAGIILQSVYEHLTRAIPWWNWIDIGASGVLNLIAFTILYWIMPRAPVKFWHAVAGAFFVAIVWEIGRNVLQAIIVRGNYTAYGIVGTFIALMLWVYYASLLLFLGAQMVQVIGYPTDERPESSA